MPASRRKRQVTLTNTKKQGRAHKTELVDKIRAAVDEFENLFLLSFQNMRSNKFKQVRMEWKDSRFFLGKNKIMQVALGRTEEEEYQENMSKISERLNGSVGILATNRSIEEVQSYFAEFAEAECARAGFVATESVALKQGPLPQFIHSMTEPLRKLGLPVELKIGVVSLYQDFQVCNKGDVLTPEQAKILGHLDNKMSEFRIKVLCSWERESTTYTKMADDDIDTGADLDDVDM